ncbi:c-type cytochrome [Foetidibacter luteolus]|uniref:c-type cytochrome n=1 Tax=Foetidibacter luteolus TaxID=2608880 RepID=UPI00129A462E|nr:cytochrome c [Foetidibacter luteolus]
MKKLLVISFLLVCATSILAQEVTYYKDVQPIIAGKCAPCHRPGEAGPFSLLTYDDVARRASFIKDVVQSRYMPPWRADNKYVHFANDRSLSQKEIDVIVKWVNNKAPEGKQVAKPAVSKPMLEGTQYSRQPDMVLKMTDSFLVKGDGGERFIVFKIPFELADTANVEAIEFLSNNRKLVHHVNYAVHAVPDTAVDLYKTDAFINLTDDDRKKFDQYQPYRKTITYYGGWIPGTTYESYPKDFGWVMPKRGVILMTVHFAPGTVDQNSLNGINLFFKKTPIARKVKVISFGSGGIGEKDITPTFFIKANEKKSFSLDVMNPSEDFSIMYVWPHMHYIGKEYKAYIIKPGGDTVRLVHIPDWDFRWQEIYRFPKLVRAPKGSVIHIEGLYDNTASNPFNPHNPPQTVWSFGDMQSTNEMLTLMMVFLPYKQGDEKVSLE